MTEANAIANQVSQAQDLAGGRRALIAACGALIIAQSIFLLLSILRGTPTPAEAIQFVVLVACVFAVFVGHNWTRLLLAFTAVVGSLFAARFAWSAVASGSSSLVAFLFVLSLIFGASGALLLFSRQIELFVSSQRRAE